MNTRDKTHCTWDGKVYKDEDAVRLLLTSPPITDFRFGHVWTPYFDTEGGICMDATKALWQKRDALIKQQREIREEAKRRTTEIGKQINAIEAAIATINDALEDCICPICRGKGTVRHCDAAGQMESCDCEHCHGTGIKG